MHRDSHNSDGIWLPDESLSSWMGLSGHKLFGLNNAVLGGLKGDQHGGAPLTTKAISELDRFKQDGYVRP